MSPYTTANITLLRTKHIASPTWRLSIAPMSKLKIWSGLVNTSTTRGLSTIYFDGGTLHNGASYSDLLAGQLLTVQTAKSLVRLRLKSLTGTATSGTLTVGENNTVWADNLPLTIYRDYPLFGIRPKISAAGVFYKDENVAYVDENQYPPPVAIMGPDWAGWLSGDPATLDATDSYPMTYGATIASYLWTVEPTVGATIASPTSSTTTISFTIAGPYWVKLQVTDTNGNVGYTRALFHAHDTTTYPPFAVARATFASDFDRSGGDTDFAASDVDSLDLIPAYGRMTLWSEDRLDGVLTTANGGWSGREHIKRVSYITKDSIKRIPGSHQVSFSASTVLDMLDRIANYSVSLKYLATPTTWFEYGNRGITVAQALHHLWKWHSTLFEIASVYLPTSNDLRAYAVDDFERGSLLSQARTFAFQHGIFAQIACTDQGVIHVEQDAQLFPTIIPAGFTLAEGDWEKEMTLERQPIPECNFVDLSGFGFDGSYNTPLLSQAPGYVIAEVGARELQFTRCILDDQAASNVLSGRLLAKENNETPTLSLTLTAPLSLGNTFQVVPQKWHDLTLAVDETARIDWSSGIDLVVRRIETEYTPGSCIQRLTFEPYSEGEDGIIGNYPKPVTPDLTGKCWEMRLDPDGIGVKTIPLPNGGTLTAYTGYGFFETDCPTSGGGGQKPPDIPDIPEDDELPDILYPDCEGSLVLPNPIEDITICWVPAHDVDLIPVFAVTHNVG